MFKIMCIIMYSECIDCRAEELTVSPEDNEKADMRIVQAAAEEVRPACVCVCVCVRARARVPCTLTH